MIGIIIGGMIGIGILFLIIYLGVKSANNSNIPKASEQKSLSRMSRRELRKLA